MIENGSIIELSNEKKYMITDSSIEDGIVYYLSLVVDKISEIPTEESVFFKQIDQNTLVPITNPDDVDFLKTIFVNKFLQHYMNEIEQ